MATIWPVCEEGWYVDTASVTTPEISRAPAPERTGADTPPHNRDYASTLSDSVSSVFDSKKPPQALRKRSGRTESEKLEAPGGFVVYASRIGSIEREARGVTTYCTVRASGYFLEKAEGTAERCSRLLAHAARASAARKVTKPWGMKRKRRQKKKHLNQDVKTKT